MYATLKKQIKNTDLPPYFLNVKITRKDMISFFCIFLASYVFTYLVIS